MILDKNKKKCKVKFGEVTITDNIDSLVFDMNFTGTASSLYECGLIRRKVA